MSCWPPRVRDALVLVALATSSLAGGAQNAGDRAAGALTRPTADERDWLAEATTLRASGRHRDALPLLAQAVTAARTTGRDADLLTALSDLASSQYNVGDLAAARLSAFEAATLAEHLGQPAARGRAALLLSIIDDAGADAASARQWVAAAIAAFASAGAIGDQLQAELQQVRVGGVPAPDRPAILSGIAARARAAGQLGVAARALHSLGDDHFNHGRLDAAYETLTEVAALFADLDDPVALGTAYNSLGRVYRAHGRLDEALAMQKAALALHERASDSFALMQSLNAVGAVSQRLGDLIGAIDHTRHALALAASSGSGRAQDVLAANYAALLLESGEAEEAARILTEVIARGRDPYVSVRQLQLAEALTRLGKLDEAMQAAEAGVTACQDAPPDQCVNAYVSRAAVRARRGDARASLDDLNVALGRLEALRGRLVPADFFRQRFHQLYTPLFDRAIALQSAHASAITALETAERARARAMLDLLASRSIAAADDAPHLANAPLPASEAPLSLDVETTTADDPLATLVRRGGSEVTASGRQAATPLLPATVDQLVASAARLGSTVVSYWVTDTDLYVWVVTGTGHVASRRVPVLRSRLAALVRATTPGGGRAPEAARAWHELYGYVIAPIAPALPTAPGALLTIVPHGPLLSLSFAALPNARGRYLLEDYTLHYVPAGALLTYTASRRRPDARSAPLLAIADPLPPRRSALDVPLVRLPGARREAAAVARLPRAGGVRILQDDQATEAHLRDALASSAVLHFATHAIVRNDDPLASFLSLTASGRTSESDGALTAREVYDLRLHADLVVLSACQTAGGIVTGDGVATFARSFLSAGAATLVASLWDVADEPTPQLLPRFYEAWQGGASKAAALRSAQLRLLDELRRRRIRVATPLGPVTVPEHPVFWSGFMLFGEPD